jgi:hypothetical protein
LSLPSACGQKSLPNFLAQFRLKVVLALELLVTERQGREIGVLGLQRGEQFRIARVNLVRELSDERLLTRGEQEFGRPKRDFASQFADLRG